jgi:DnaD/phage-associated family protein
MKKTDKIHINLNYGTGVAVLPESVLPHIDKAKKLDIKVLFLIASSDKYRTGNYEQLMADELGCEVADIANSVAFWNGTGVLVLDGTETVKTVKKEKDTENNVPKRAKVSELPQYTSAELNALLQKHNNVVGLIDECQNVLGKIFTAADIKVLMGFVDYLGLDNDYILVLMHYAARNDMKSLRYIEKIAVSCIDDGFTDAKVLQQALYAREEKAQIETKIKNIFGLRSRKLTSKEQKQVDAWVRTYNYDLDVIEKAYEITVSATNKPSVHYANAILEKWFAEGIKNIEDVNALLAAREQEKVTEGSSFDVDDFFAAALKRSYSEE